MGDFTAAEVVAFWRDAGPDKWWEKDDAFDHLVRSTFLPAHETAARGELTAWQDSAEGALALVILLDQFPRNMFRGSPHAFATDPLARSVAEAAIARGLDTATDEEMRIFFYMPYMHSEILTHQDRCVELMAALADAGSGKYAAIHRDIIAKFGRFPHRNRALGRLTTPAEKEFLDAGGFAG